MTDQTPEGLAARENTDTTPLSDKALEDIRSHAQLWRAVHVVDPDELKDIDVLLAEVDRLREVNAEQADELHRRRMSHTIAVGNAYNDHTKQLSAALDEARGEVAFHHTWDGLMALVEQHYPEGIFPTVASPDTRDPGPRIVSLVRWVDQLHARNADLHRRLGEHMDDLGDARTERDATRLANSALVEAADRSSDERDALAARLDAVRAIHYPVTADEGHTPMGHHGDVAWGAIRTACHGCGPLDGYAVPWPCATARALGETGGEEAAPPALDVAAPGDTERLTLDRTAEALHQWADDLTTGARRDWPHGEADVIRGIQAAADWIAARATYERAVRERQRDELKAAAERLGASFRQLGEAWRDVAKRAREARRVDEEGQADA
ncbi:hypothetical protein [Glycomyces arizonensis]|uniref:hypothetical protein n=1 Tax=Glycomyces arizonensis TaxID=256035 RepID=UPI00041A5240|nr:hypothetical protein [Glycomyces arizonensis]